MMKHLDGFFAYLQFQKRYSDKTIAAYRSDIAQFESFLSDNALSAGEDLLAVTHKQVRLWIIDLSSRAVQPRSIGRKISALRAYYKYLLKKGVLSKNPMTKVVVPKSGRRLPLFIDKAGMDKMYKAFDTHVEPSEATTTFTDIRDALIIDLLYAAGLRRSELIDLKLESIDWATAQLRVVGKGSKERILPLGKPTLTLLTIYLQERNTRFGSAPGRPLILTGKGEAAYPNLIYRVVQQAMAGNTTLSRKSPHVLRHTFATHLSNNGAELNAVKELLGHSSLASTQVYTHSSINKLKEIYKKAHPKGG